MNMTALADLVGLADPLDPRQMRFTVKPGKSCAGCLFSGQRSSVCKVAASLGALAGLPDCDTGYVYVPVAVDPRQLSIVEKE